MNRRNSKGNSVPPPVDSVVLYERFWMCWKIVGIGTDYNEFLCGLYDICVNIFITIYYPLHLTIGLFMEPTVADVFKVLAINVTCIATLSQLDKRAMDMDEREYFSRVPKAGAQFVVNAFFGAYIMSNLAAASAALLSSERRLMYPAWFPFDWRATTLNYWVALLYQFFGITIQIIQNLANDIYAPMSLCIIAGHVRMLGMRLSKLGHDTRKSTTQINSELINCVEDHKKLLEIFEALQDTLSIAQLSQFISSGLNICIVLVYLLFYADNIFASIYYSVYFIAMAIEIFPCCYYGSIMQQEFLDLPYAVFKSNWLKQNNKFRKNMIIFTELAKKEITPIAGGVIGIHLNAFFYTCKMAYSLFAVLRS